jgi:hypothetical protein
MIENMFWIEKTQRKGRDRTLSIVIEVETIPSAKITPINQLKWTNIS